MFQIKTCVAQTQPVVVLHFGSMRITLTNYPVWVIIVIIILLMLTSVIIVNLEVLLQLL